MKQSRSFSYAKYGYLFSIPFIVVFCIFNLYPTVYTAILGFTDCKGLGNTDWGMKNRLARMFRPESGNTVMLAFDHGYIMGSTAGLERLDVTIAPLCKYADVLKSREGVGVAFDDGDIHILYHK